MKLPKSLYNLQGPEQIRAFQREMFMYPVIREGLFPQEAEVVLKQALVELEKSRGSQANHDQSLKDKNILQGIEKDFLGDRNVEISEYHKVLDL